METKIYQSTELTEAAKILQAGGLIAFPTETVYGLGADALLPAAVKRVFAVKGRPSDNPLIVHVTDFDMVKIYVDKFHPLTKTIIENFWPGPLTVIFEIKKGSLPLEVTGGLSTAAFRMPDNKKTLDLIRLTGEPLVGPSANTSGKPSPTTAEHVYHDLKGKIEGIVEDGATQIGVESTVLDLSGDVPMILRPGAITKEDLEKVLQTPVAVDKHLITESETPKSPGMKYKHYSPDLPVYMVQAGDWQAALAWAGQQQLKAGLLASPKVISSCPKTTAWEFADDTVEAATQGLFAGLRALDESDAEVIFAEVFPEEGLGAAYMNRLKKAAALKYFSKDMISDKM